MNPTTMPDPAPWIEKVSRVSDNPFALVMQCLETLEWNVPTEPDNGTGPESFGRQGV